MRTCVGVVFLLLSLSCSGPQNAEPVARTAQKPVAVGEQAVDCSDPSVAINYTASFEPGKPKVIAPTLQVTFTKRPSSTDIENALRTCIAKTASTWDINGEMLANAWRGEQGPLPLPDGSSGLVYNPETGSTQTTNEHEGVKSVASAPAGRSYHVVYSEEKVAVPPYGKFAMMDVVFEKAPAEEAIYRALVVEIRAAVVRQSPRLNTTAFAKYGPRTNPAGQRQIADKSGKFISAEYDPKNGEVRSTSGKLLTTIR
jgi:hypothetical protein